MKKLLFSVAILMAFATVSFAGSPKSEVPTPAKTEASAEQKEFYINDDKTRIDIEYPSAGLCEDSDTLLCHATFTRANSSSPWVLIPGTEIYGVKPF
jgi:hypothetical protein